jgi:hypothetical protein
MSLGKKEKKKGGVNVREKEEIGKIKGKIAIKGEINVKGRR